MRGTVTRFDSARGIGAIRAGDVPERFMVEGRAIQGSDHLEAGQKVQFDAAITEHGLRAINVIPGRRPASPRIVHTAGGIAMAMVAAVVYSAGLGLHWFIGWLLAVNLVTFGYYAWDKNAAANAEDRERARRIPELTLHLLAASGGSIGGLLARRFLHHKTSKMSFLLRARLIIAVQLVLIVGYIRRWGTDLPL